MRARLKVAINVSEETLKTAALGLSKVAELIAGKEIRKVVIVPNRLVNIVSRISYFMSMWKDFKEFAVKGNAVDLAVAVIIGAALARLSPPSSMTFLCHLWEKF